MTGVSEHEWQWYPFFYVDDIALLGRNIGSLNHLKQDLKSRYEIRDLGALE